MRVIAGLARGRKLRSGGGVEVRPTPDRVKEALFSIIAARVPGASFLDLYAGYGGVGIEALSRGARRAVLVEKSDRAARLAQVNLETTGLAAAGRVVTARVEEALPRLERKGEKFDIVFMDPPYDIPSLDRLLDAVSASRCLNPGALVILQYGQKRAVPARVNSLAQVDLRHYGKTSLAFYRREEALE